MSKDFRGVSQFIHLFIIPFSNARNVVFNYYYYY